MTLSCSFEAVNCTAAHFLVIVLNYFLTNLNKSSIKSISVAVPIYCLLIGSLISNKYGFKSTIGFLKKFLAFLVSQ